MSDVTHLGLYDIPMISNIPNLVYLAPTCREEYLAMLDWSMQQREHPVAIRVPVNDLTSYPDMPIVDYSQLNRSIVTQEGSETAIFALGTFYSLGLELAKAYEQQTGRKPTLINPVYITGTDEALLEKLKERHKLVITLEDGILDGGYGEKIARFYGDSEMKVLCCGLKKEFPDRYDVSEILRKNHLTPQQILEDKNLRVKIVEANDDSVPAGQVVSQYPEAGAKVKEQRLVTITVSKGGQELTMPDLKSMSRSNAEEKLKKMGLKLGAVFEENAKEPAGTVINQDPRSGSKITKGQTVDITVSLGEKKKEITVQNYTGLSVDSAKSNLEANGLSLGGISEEASTRPKGTVIGQSPSAGSTTTEGGSVSLIISSGSSGGAKSDNNQAPTPSAATAKGKTDAGKSSTGAAQ